MNKAVYQRAFDIVAEHLLKQKEKCMDGNSCVYRSKSITGEVTKCAIGALIPDELYDESIETLGVVDDEVFNLVLEGNPWMRGKHERALQYKLINLQGLHDQIPVDSWYDKLEHIAFEDRLQWNFEGYRNG